MTQLPLQEKTKQDRQIADPVPFIIMNTSSEAEDYARIFLIASTVPASAMSIAPIIENSLVPDPPVDGSSTPELFVTVSV